MYTTVHNLDQSIGNIVLEHGKLDLFKRAYSVSQASSHIVMVYGCHQDEVSGSYVATVPTIGIRSKEILTDPELSGGGAPFNWVSYLTNRYLRFERYMLKGDLTYLGTRDSIAIGGDGIWYNHYLYKWSDIISTLTQNGLTGTSTEPTDIGLTRGTDI
jgi:hypothetical protein